MSAPEMNFNVVVTSIVCTAVIIIKIAAGFCLNSALHYGSIKVIFFLVGCQ